jgi:hypothetical protein
MVEARPVHLSESLADHRTTQPSVLLQVQNAGPDAAATPCRDSDSYRVVVIELEDWPLSEAGLVDQHGPASGEMRTDHRP